jgi:hypothetical protein
MIRPTILLLLVTSSLPAQAPRDVVARAVQAMGGEAAVRGLRNKTADFYSAISSSAGKGLSPPGPRSVRRIITDYAARHPTTRRSGAPRRGESQARIVAAASG